MWTKHLLPFMWTKHLWYPTRIDNSKDSAVIETRLYRPPRSSQGRVTSEQRFQAHDWVVQNKWTVQGPKPYCLDIHRSECTGTHIYQQVYIFRTERTQHNLKLEDLVSITGVNFPKSRNWELSICSPTERQGTSYEGLQIGNIPYILDTGRVGKKKKYICWAEEAIRAMESSANQLLGNLCLVPSKTFCENVLTNVKNKSFPFFFP